jgi:pyridinium-3,5-bisthiocarboxylic acid mononucleotide nickel chelatase
MTSEPIILIEPFSGISGDMFLGALLDLGADFQRVEASLRRLPVSGYRLEKHRCMRAGIQATKFDVLIDSTHLHHDREHQHKTFREIRTLIENAGLSPWVKEKSQEAFRRLAVAEGKVHGMAPDDVHFHEVGAVDCIIDIVGTMLAAEQLQPARFICGAINVGRGTLKCHHGIYPVPAPATQEILTGIPTFANEVDGELTTPTGAALVMTLASAFLARPMIKVRSSGYGAGTRDIPGNANVLRLALGDPVIGTQPIAPEEQMAVIEANIDDMSPQVYSYFQERAFIAGAVDVYATPVQMKKNRPALLVTVICPSSLVDSLSELLFAETTTTGIRYTFVQRKTLERRFERVQTPYGEVAVKVALSGGRCLKAVPEYEDCRRIAARKGLPLRKVLDAATHAYWSRQDRGDAESDIPNSHQPA